MEVPDERTQSDHSGLQRQPPHQAAAGDLDVAEAKAARLVLDEEDPQSLAEVAFNTEALASERSSFCSVLTSLRNPVTGSRFLLLTSG